MNNCILMAEVVEAPQLRYTSDSVAVSEMTVQFEGLKEGDPPATLKVVGWGNLAQDIQERYHEGDRVLIEGRLNINSIDRDGFKEKRAELTAQRVHLLSGEVTSSGGTSGTSGTMSAASPASNPARSTPKASTATKKPAETATPAYSAPATDDLNYDDIPF